MKILVINAGSSSLKYSIFEGEQLNLIANGLVEKIGDQGGKIIHKFVKNNSLDEIEIDKDCADHHEALENVVALLMSEEHGVIEGIDEINAVGHRVVHGGEYYSAPSLITEDLKSKVEALIPLAPLHNPPNLLGIKVSEDIFPEARQVAVFDTAFHQTIPEHAYRYAVPEKFYKEYGIRVYGMHGTSHMYVTEQTAEYLGKQKEEVNLLTLHLGNGCSISAVKNGKCIETSLGLSPLPGLVMGTRSGDIDPTIIFHLIRQHGYTYEEVESMLNKESGLKGLAGVTDLRDLHRMREEGDKSAQLAFDIYSHRIKKYIGAYYALTGPVDAIVFTAGVGENDRFTRSSSLQGLEHLGISLDEEKNSQREPGIRELQNPDSKVKILVVPTDEEKQIAMSALKFL